MSNQTEASAKPAFSHKRKLRNYLLDVGLQLRYTAFIILVAVFLTSILGYKVYQATQESSRIVLMTVQADPATGAELMSQFQANDRIVLWGMAGFGVVLILSIAAVGIWMTHKVAGPLHNIGMTCANVRDDRLPPVLRQLRKGDELQAFYSQFGEMYAALRTRVIADIALLDHVITALENQTSRPADVEQVLADLRAQRQRKQDSIEPPARR